MTLRLVTAPTVEPITPAEVREWGRIGDTGNSALLSLMISAARRAAEHKTGRKLITQTWELVLDQFPANEIEIGALPVQSIAFVKYYDADGVLQTLDSGDYVLDKDALPGWILPAYEFSWPATHGVANAVIARFVAGYGVAGSDVPADIRAWISAQVSASYDNPDGLLAGDVKTLGFLDGLLDEHGILHTV